MNIFKILANGDGSINEPNVSAFLGYLLDPYEDHGIGFEFLERFLEKIVIDRQIDVQKYDYEIFLEQAFKAEDKSKQIVDIVIFCIDSNSTGKKEMSYHKTLKTEKKVEYIFLIENKIRRASKKSKQLENQLTSTISELKNTHGIKVEDDRIFSIYITPKDNILIEEFEKFKSNNKTHLYWKNDDKQNTDSLLEILRHIVKSEAEANIDPINDYTKHTIKSFIKFIDNDFKSERQQKSERKNDGSYTKRYTELNAKTNIEENLKILRNDLIQKNIVLKNLISEADMSVPMTPKLLIHTNDIIIEIICGSLSRDRVSVLFRLDSKMYDKSLSKLKQIAKKLQIDIKNSISKVAYCRTKEMQSNVLLSDIDEINKVVQKAIKDSI